MTPEQLHRNHIKALAAADLEGAAKLRARFGPHGEQIALDYLRATVAVCLEYRFGPGAGLGARPVDYDELASFMSEVREAGRSEEPPPDHLAVEAAVRSLYGEPHLLEPLSSRERSRALYLLLRHQLGRHPWLRSNIDTVVDRAKQVMTTWILG